MRLIFAATGAVALTVLGACAPQVPDSAAGVGFDNSIEAQRAREAELAGLTPAGVVVDPLNVTDEQAAVSALPEATAIEAAPLPAGLAAQSGAQSATDDIALGAAAAIAASDSASGVLQASPSNPAPTQVRGPGLSDENDFAAVSNRESIESDAARIAQNKSQYQVVAPTALPSRDTDAQPNIVQYALSTSNPVGNKIYSRAGINLKDKAARNCAAFPSADLAQIAFLEAGGPQKDRRTLDPDGDGYACSWNPTTFRNAVQN
jgi:hypothetical protein